MCPRTTIRVFSYCIREKVDGGLAKLDVCSRMLTYAHVCSRMQVDTGLAKHPGIFLGGNYVCGVAFGSCVEWGLDTAPKIVEFLKTKAPAKEKVPA